MKSARVSLSSFKLVTDVIVVSMRMKHKLHIRRRSLCVRACTNGGYTLGLCVYGLILGFDCYGRLVVGFVRVCWQPKVMLCYRFLSMLATLF